MPIHRHVLVPLVLLLSGCDGARRPAPTARILPVPELRQDLAQGCGITAIDMLVAYYDRPLHSTARDELRQQVTDGGLNATGLQEAFRQSGYESYLLRGRLAGGPDSPQHHLDRQRPLLVQIRQRSHHWVLVIGTDPAREEVVLADPARGRIAYPHEEFEALWHAADHLLLLAVPTAMPDATGSPPSAGADHASSSRAATSEPTP